MRSDIKQLATRWMAAVEADLRSSDRPLAPTQGLVRSKGVLRPGELWTMQPPEGSGLGTLALVVKGPASPEVVIATDEVWMATDKDVVVSGPESPTGEPLAFVGGRRPVGRDCLGVRLGKMDKATLTAIDSLASTNTRASRRPIAPVVHPEGWVFLRWSQGRGGRQFEFTTGTPGGDARDQARQTLLAATAYVSQSAATSWFAGFVSQLARAMKPLASTVEKTGRTATKKLPAFLEPGPAVASALRSTSANLQRRTFPGQVKVGTATVSFGLTVTPTELNYAVTARAASGAPLKGVRVCLRPKPGRAVEQKTGTDGLAMLTLSVQAPLEGLTLVFEHQKARREIHTKT